MSVLTTIGRSFDTAAMARAIVSKPKYSRDSQAPPVDYALLARLVVREGKPFKDAAIMAGYSKGVALQGLKSAMAQSSPLSQAIEAEWKLLETNVTHLKPFAVARLHKEITDPNSYQGIRAIEVAGKFKEADWFVRSVADVQVGIINTVAVIEPDAKLTDYKEPTE